MGAEAGHGQDTIASDATQAAKGHADSHFRHCYCCNWARASEKATDGRGILGILGKQCLTGKVAKARHCHQPTHGQ